jgi:hypothetical protein
MTENNVISEDKPELATSPEPMSAEHARTFCQWKLAGLMWEQGISAGEEVHLKAAAAYLEKNGQAVIEKVLQGNLTAMATFYEFECSFGEWLYKEVLPDLIMQLDIAECSEFIRFRDYCSRNLAGVLYRCMEYTGSRERAEVDWECAARCTASHAGTVNWFRNNYGLKVKTQEEFDEMCGRYIFYGIYWQVKDDCKKGLPPYASVLFE